MGRKDRPQVDRRARAAIEATISLACRILREKTTIKFEYEGAYNWNEFLAGTQSKLRVRIYPYFGESYVAMRLLQSSKKLAQFVAESCLPRLQSIADDCAETGNAEGVLRALALLSALREFVR
jgi:hypothetical protein